MNETNLKLESLIVAATGNQNKTKQFSAVAKKYGYNIISASECAKLYNLPPPPEVDETGTTYAENAILKAEAFAQWCNMPCLGDDSGLEVAALNNRPGLYSARYGGEGLTDLERVNLLLKELKETGSKDRSARFHCSLALVIPQDKTIKSQGQLIGEVLEHLSGKNGFGYDPIIKINSLGTTLANLSQDKICEVGFRAVALKNLFENNQW